MKTLPRLFLTALSGGLACALFWTLVYFFGGFIFAGSRQDLLLLSAVGGFAGLFVGGLIGFVTGVLKSGPGRGVLVGLLATLIVVAFYVISNSGGKRISYWLQESVAVLLLFGVPALLAGLVAGLVSKRLLRTSIKAPPFVDSPRPL